MNDLPEVTEILKKYNVGGLAFCEVNARGRTKIKELHDGARIYDGKEIYSRT